MRVSTIFTTPKYHNTKTVIDGISFDSKKEAEYYKMLKLLEKNQIIKNLKLQPRYELIPSFTKNGIKHRKCEYIADFEYIEDGKTVVVDTKGFKTDVYKLKRKLFEYKYPNLTIKEI